MKKTGMNQLRQEIGQDIAFVVHTLTNHAADTNRRFEGMADSIEEMSRRIQTDLRQMGADSEERFNQMAGRMRQMEQRLTTVLGAADHDRTESRSHWADLERRVSELERRLPPPSPAA